MLLFDTHVNLHSERFAEDRTMVLDRARKAGIGAFISICDRLDSFPLIEAMAQAGDIWCSVGIHPHHARDYPSIAADSLIGMALACPKICAIGETGLDYHYNYSAPSEQKRLFGVHIEAARAVSLPLIIHCRAADADMADILSSEMGNGSFTPLLHCYTGGVELAELALDLGAFFSVSGILAFRNADNVREVMRNIPLERIVLETDCPYLAPPPYRGRRNEPAFLLQVCSALASLQGRDVEEVAAITSDNAQRLFKVAAFEPGRQ